MDATKVSSSSMGPAAAADWTTWLATVLGAVAVGLCGLVPLLMLPSYQDRSRRAIKQSGDDRVEEECSQDGSLVRNKLLRRHLSFAVGSLLGDVFLHLLPAIYSGVVHHPSSTVGLTLLSGILVFLVVERSYGTGGGDDAIGYLNLFANCLDNFVHGLAVATGFLTSTRLGLVTVAAILIHEVPHEVADFAILLRSGFSRWDAGKAQILTALVGVTGAIVSLSFNLNPDTTGKSILAFSAGGFTHVALVSILPDLMAEDDPKESLIHLLLITVGTAVMAVVSLA